MTAAHPHDVVVTTVGEQQTPNPNPIVNIHHRPNT